MVLILMGVSGCGKTTVGKQLSIEMQIPFYDADDFHPPANVEKMRKGTPLDDEDRQPWLERLHQMILKWNKKDGAILACSALKKSYRQTLRGDLDKNELQFIYLKGSAELIRERLQHREGHYMPAGLLNSQFRDLEEPSDVLTAGIDRPVETIVSRIIDKLDEKP
jgi:carbohydrate kinase (thermoresistant glucokinase family)